MFRWLTILAGLTAGCAVGETVDLGGTIAIHGRFAAAAAFGAWRSQTGCRVGGLAGLPAGETAIDVAGPAPAALRAVASQTHTLVVRTGLWDWLVLPTPELPPPPPATTSAGPVRLLLRGAHYPVKAGTNELALPLRLLLEVDVEADSDLDVAWLSALDTDSLRLQCDSGEEPQLLPEVYRPADSRRLRLGQLASLPFSLPAAEATSATLRGELLLFESLQPVSFVISPEAIGSRVTASEVELRVVSAEPRGGSWRLTVGLRRPLVLGDPEPWVDALLTTTHDVRVRPREMVIREAAMTRDEAAADDRPAEQLVRLDFDLPEGDAAARVELQLARRQRPWQRVPFELGPLPLPRSPLAASAAP